MSGTTILFLRYFLNCIIIDLLASYDLNGQLSALEDLIAQGADKRMVLRMLILANLTFGGIKTKPLENIKKEVLQVRPRFAVLHTSQ